MSAITDARNALARIIADNCPDADLATYGHVPGGEFTYPLGWVELGEGRMANTQSTRQMIEFRFVVLVGVGDIAHAQQRLDALISGGSVTRAVTANRTLDGTVLSCSPSVHRPLTNEQVAGYKSFGHEWLFDVALET